MENSKEAVPVGEDSVEQKSQKFNKSDSSIFIEKVGKKIPHFYVKAGEVLILAKFKSFER